MFKFILILFTFLSLMVSASTFIKGPALVESTTVTATAAGTLTLTKDSNTRQVFTGADVHNLVLPDATTLPVNRSFKVINNSSDTITVQYDSGSTFGLILAGASREIVLTNNGTSDGTWIMGSNNITAEDLTVSGNLVLSGNSYGPNINVGDMLANDTSTGLLTGGGLSINGGNPALFDVAAGTGFVVDSTDPSNPSITYVSWAGFTGETVTNLATQELTWVYIDSGGAIYQSNVSPTPQLRRDYILLGRLNHSDNTTVQFTNTVPDFNVSTGSQLYDLIDAIGPFSVSGNIVTANGANLSIDKSTGFIFQRSTNISTTNQNPHIKTTGPAVAASFVYVNQDASTGGTVTTLDTANYDLAGVTTAIPGSTNRATVQRVYLFSSNNIRIQRGQVYYNSLAEAISGISSESFVTAAPLDGFAVLVAYIVVTKGCTDLTNTTCAKIIQVGKFAGSGVGGGGASTMQQVYDNSVQPQITLNSTNLGIEILDNATPIAASLFKIANNGETVNYLGVDTSGISSNALTMTGTTGALKLHLETTAQVGALTAAQGMLVFDTDLDVPVAYTGTYWEPIVGTTQLTTTVADAGTLTFLAYHEQVIRVEGVTVPSTVGAVVHTALKNGDIVTLAGTSDSVPLTLVDVSGLILNGSCTLYDDETLTLMKVDGNLIEISRSN